MQQTLTSTAQEIVPCPRCQSDEYVTWASENGFDAVRCFRCRTIYVRNRPRLDLIAEATREGVHPTEAGNLDVRHGWRPWKVKQYERIIRTFFPNAKGLRWLDVGAGYGEVVAAVSKAIPGSTVVGIEPMQAKAAAAQRRGVPVYERLLSQEQGTYDVVSLINVFSHLPDFPSFVEDIKRVLAPNGMLFIQTGDADGLTTRADFSGPLYLPDHLMFIGTPELTRWLAELGFHDPVHHAYPHDVPLWALRETIRNLQRGKLKIVWPYQSPFMSVCLRVTRRG